MNENLGKKTQPMTQGLKEGKRNGINIKVGVLAVKRNNLFLRYMGMKEG